jgi:hypothetical protein
VLELLHSLDEGIETNLVIVIIALNRLGSRNESLKFGRTEVHSDAMEYIFNLWLISCLFEIRRVQAHGAELFRIQKMDGSWFISIILLNDKQINKYINICDWLDSLFVDIVPNSRDSKHSLFVSLPYSIGEAKSSGFPQLTVFF